MGVLASNPNRTVVFNELCSSDEFANCEPYHTTEMPNGKTIRGPWDLRLGEGACLGGIDLDNSTVFELGPATGHMTYWMERAGAAVTSLEVGYDRSVDVIPSNLDDVASFRRSIMGTVQRINRPLPTGTENLTGWWHMTPAAVAEMLDAVGFGTTEITTHRQLYHPGHDMTQPAVEVDMFTVVGRR